MRLLISQLPNIVHQNAKINKHKPVQTECDVKLYIHAVFDSRSIVICIFGNHQGL